MKLACFCPTRRNISKNYRQFYFEEFSKFFDGNRKIIKKHIKMACFCPTSRNISKKWSQFYFQEFFS